MPPAGNLASYVFVVSYEVDFPFELDDFAEPVMLEPLPLALLLALPVALALELSLALSLALSLELFESEDEVADD